MKNFITCTATFAVVFLALPATAGTIFTPALPTDGATATVNCRLLNNGNKAAEDVNFEIRNSGGIPTESTTFASIQSDQTNSLTETNPGSIHYCVVSGKRVSKGKSDVTLCALDFSGTPLECVAAP